MSIGRFPHFDRILKDFPGMTGAAPGMFRPMKLPLAAYLNFLYLFQKTIFGYRFLPYMVEKPFKFMLPTVLID